MLSHGEYKNIIHSGKHMFTEPYYV